jgi:hypothetical protein
MAVSKRESRIRRLFKKLRSCLPKAHPHHKYRSSYLEIEKQPPPPLPQHIHAQRHGLIGRREMPSKKTTSAPARATDRDASPGKRALPSPGRLRVVPPQELPKDETIRFVDKSFTSIAKGRPGAFTGTPRYAGRIVQPTRQQMQRDQALYRLEQGEVRSEERPSQPPEEAKPLVRVPGVLPYNESLITHRAINRQLPQTPAKLRHDSAADLSVRPLNVRPRTYHTAYSDVSLEESMASMNLEQHPSARASHPVTATGSKFTEALNGCEHEWDSPNQHRVGDSKGIWKTASHRLMIRNKDSIQKLEAEKAVRERMEKRMDIVSREQQTQVRSIQSIEEMAEEQRRAGEEWNGESLPPYCCG